MGYLEYPCSCKEPILVISSNPKEIEIRQDERAKIVNFIQKVAKCWVDDIIVTSVLDSLIWELEHGETLDSKETL